jgi:hypothetical protein
MTQMPYEDGIARLVQHMHRHYFSQLPQEQVAAVLRRGGPSFWNELRFRTEDPEFLQGWLLNNLLQWELNMPQYARSPDDLNPSQIHPHVAATATWIQAMQDVCSARNVPLVVLLAPTGTVDPSFREFWKPWPAYYSFNYYQDARHAALRQKLQDAGIYVVDLRETLAGTTGTYRKTDAHWNEKGHEIVAERVVQEIQWLRDAARSRTTPGASAVAAAEANLVQERKR